MEINIDFLLAGCNTRCKHCYVNGGPAPMMKTHDALQCIEKLDRMAAFLPQGTSFTLDNEPINHPQICKIIAAAASTEKIRYDHHGMTTGLALIARDDRDAVTDAYLAHGYDFFGITFHGIGAHHDEMVCQNGAFACSVQAANYIKARGLRLEVSLMLNRFFEEDGEGIIALLDKLSPDQIYVAIPIFTPHKRMRAFEPYRATSLQTARFRDMLWGWKKQIPVSGNFQTAHTPKTAATRFDAGATLDDLFAQPQLELFLSLHHDARLFAGNTGVETGFLCDLRIADSQAVAEKITALPGNRDYGAFYDPRRLPPTHALRDALEALPQSAAYGDFPSVVYRALDALDVPTVLLS